MSLSLEDFGSKKTVTPSAPVKTGGLSLDDFSPSKALSVNDFTNTSSIKTSDSKPIASVKAPDTSKMFQSTLGTGSMLTPKITNFGTLPSMTPMYNGKSALPDVKEPEASIPLKPLTIGGMTLFDTKAKTQDTLTMTPEGKQKQLTDEAGYLDTESKKINDMGAALKKQEAKVNLSDKKSVADYNKKSEEYNSAVSAYKDRESAYNDGVKENNANQAIYTKPNGLQNLMMTAQEKGILPKNNKVVNSVTQVVGDVIDDTSSKISDFFGSFDSDKSAADRVNASGQAVLGLSNLIAMPIAVLLNEADKTPGLEKVSHGIEQSTELINKGVSDRVRGYINQIPDTIISKSAKDTIGKTMGDLVAAGTLWIIGGEIHENLPKLKEGLTEVRTMITKDVIKNTFPEKTVYFNADQIKDIWQTNTLLSESEKSDILKVIGEDNTKIKDAIKNGVSIEVSPKTLVTLEDKPYWTAIKSFFGKDKESTPISMDGGSVKETVRGYLPEKGEISKPTPTEIVHPVLEKEVKEALATHGSDLTISEIQNKLGVDPHTAGRIVAIVRSNESLSDAGKSQKIAEAMLPKKEVQINKEKSLVARDMNVPSKSLAEEAKKYKSAEEFINSNEPVLRGGLALDKTKATEMGISVTRDRETAEAYAGSEILRGGDKGNIAPGKGAVHDLYLNPNARIFDAKKAPKDLIDFYLKQNMVKGRERIVQFAKNEGYDAVDFKNFSDPEIRIFNNDILNTKKELEDIYNKATFESLTPESSPLKPIEGTGETKITKAASDINKELVRRGFESLPTEEQSRFESGSYKEDMDRISSFMDKDIEHAKQVVLGNEPIPHEIKFPQILFNAMEAYAMKSGDISLLQGLAKSPLGKQLSESAQTLGSHGFNDNSNSPVEAIRKIRESKVKKLEKKKGGVEKAKKEIKEKIKKEIKKLAPKKENWQDFIKSITC